MNRADPSHSSSRPSSVGGAFRHRVGVCSWSLKPTSPDALADTLASLRISAVQLALSPVVNQPATWGDAVRTLRERGIDVISGMMAMKAEDYSTLKSIAMTGGVRPDATWPGNLEHARLVADVAATEKITLVTFHAGFIPHAPADHERRRILDRLGTLADLFAARGVGLALETGQETAEMLIEALEDLNRPNVGVNFDPANMILYGMGDPIESLRLLSRLVKQVHVKDALPTQMPGTWGKEVPATEGAVDWARFFEVAKAIEPVVNFVIEREAGATREADIAKARDLIEVALRSGRINQVHRPEPSERMIPPHASG